MTMAEVKGKIVICDRCGAQHFVRTTGDGEADGGFTRWNKFESLPAGWGNTPVGDVWYMLCPDCTKEWKTIADEYLRKANEFKGAQQ
jgi:hypothetical protein